MEPTTFYICKEMRLSLLIHVQFHEFCLCYSFLISLSKEESLSLEIKWPGILFIHITLKR